MFQIKILQNDNSVKVVTFYSNKELVVKKYHRLVSYGSIQSFEIV